MIVKQDKDGHWYIYRRTSGNYTGRRHKTMRQGQKTSDTWRNWWLIKYNNKDSGYVDFRKIILPKEFVGKRIRFKIEVLDVR